jgi:tRNA (cmo5U34)-methyltransferase
MDVTLVDLSRPMLDRALERVGAETSGRVAAIQGDIREIEVGDAQYDVITAAAVLHHLRTDDDWAAVFRACFRALRPGGSMWIADLVSHDDPGVQALMWARYGDYLEAFKDAAYREHVLAYVEQEDTPRSITFQCDQLRAAGFKAVEVLHKNGCFAAFGAIRT